MDYKAFFSFSLQMLSGINPDWLIAFVIGAIVWYRFARHFRLMRKEATAAFARLKKSAAEKIAKGKTARAARAEKRKDLALLARPPDANTAPAPPPLSVDLPGARGRQGVAVKNPSAPARSAMAGSGIGMAAKGDGGEAAAPSPGRSATAGFGSRSTPPQRKLTGFFSRSADTVRQPDAKPWWMPKGAQRQEKITAAKGDKKPSKSLAAAGPNKTSPSPTGLAQDASLASQPTSSKTADKTKPAGPPRSSLAGSGSGISSSHAVVLAEDASFASQPGSAAGTGGKPPAAPRSSMAGASGSSAAAAPPAQDAAAPAPRSFLAGAGPATASSKSAAPAVAAAFNPDASAVKAGDNQTGLPGSPLAGAERATLKPFTPTQDVEFVPHAAGKPGAAAKISVTPADAPPSPFAGAGTGTSRSATLAGDSGTMTQPGSGGTAGAVKANEKPADAPRSSLAGAGSGMSSSKAVVPAAGDAPLAPQADAAAVTDGKAAAKPAAKSAVAGFGSGTSAAKSKHTLVKPKAQDVAAPGAPNPFARNYPPPKGNGPPPTEIYKPAAPPAVTPLPAAAPAAAAVPDPSALAAQSALVNFRPVLTTPDLRFDVMQNSVATPAVAQQKPVDLKTPEAKAAEAKLTAENYREIYVKKEREKTETKKAEERALHINEKQIMAAQNEREQERKNAYLANHARELQARRTFLMGQLGQGDNTGTYAALAQCELELSQIPSGLRG